MNTVNTEASHDDIPAAITERDFPFMNHGQCKLFKTTSCTALTVMVPIALLLRPASLTPFAFRILMPSLCLTIVNLAVGVMLVFRAEYAANEYRKLDDHLFELAPSNQQYARQELAKYYDMVVKCEDWGVPVLKWGLTLSVGVVVALAVLMLF
jgi:hypothetical protein